MRLPDETEAFSGCTNRQNVVSQVRKALQGTAAGNLTVTELSVHGKLVSW